MAKRRSARSRGTAHRRPENTTTNPFSATAAQLRVLSVPPDVAYARAEWVFDRYAERLRAMAGVLTVDIGLRYQAGHPTGEIAVRVHVARKLPEAQLGQHIVPKQLDGVPVDVIERQFQVSRNELPDTGHGALTTAPWIAPRHAPAFFGTATLRLRDLRSEGAPCLLTCAHVLAGNHSVHDLDSDEPEVVDAAGELQGQAIRGRWVVDDRLDAALWRPQPDCRVAELVPTVSQVGRLTRADVLNRTAVWKNGAHSGFSIGQVESIRSLPIPIHMPDGSVVLARDQAQIRPSDGRASFAARGDSGAAVLRHTPEGRTAWVAMVRAVDPQGFAIACHADDVAARLEVVL